MGFYRKWVESQKEEQPKPMDNHKYGIANNPAIIDALSISVIELPSTCPFETGEPCPPGCRFSTKFFDRMIETGVLPDPVVGCPLRHVCGEIK